VKQGESCFPLYEAKMISQYDHRYASFLGTKVSPSRPSRKFEGWYGVIPSDANESALPRYWVLQRDVNARLKGRWSSNWLLGWRGISRSVDARTVIAALLPLVACTDTILLAMSKQPLVKIASLLANMNSFVFDYCARQKVGGAALKAFTLRQIPTLAPMAYDEAFPWLYTEPMRDWFAERVLELVYSAWDMQPFAHDLGFDGPPFPWDEERRFLLRCELDAAFFHLYGIERDDVDYIMETFPIVKRKDEAKWGEYRTKRVILGVYDAMQRAMETGVPYEGAVAASRTESNVIGIG
jgi:hypothetical protein